MDAPTISTVALFSLIQEYRFASRALLAELKRQFPVGCVVRYHEYSDFDNFGIVTGHKDDHLCVQHENGNGWWKPAETATRIVDKSKWPIGIRQEALRRHLCLYKPMARVGAPLPLP